MRCTRAERAGWPGGVWRVERAAVAPARPTTSSDRRDQAAVDPVVGAGDLARAVGGEEDDRRGDILRRPEPAERHAADVADEAFDGALAVGAPFGGHRVDELAGLPRCRARRARRDAVDADAARGELVGERLREQP